jgi:hypothetical protein
MLITSTVPESARATLRIIDDALEYLAAKDRMDHFNKHENELRVRQRTKHLGFEREVIDQLFLYLKEKHGNIVLDEVSVPGRRVDLAISVANCPAFIEMGMYFGGFRTKYGTTDCRKVRDILDKQPAAIGVLIHFHFYVDWDNRIHNYFQKELPDLELGEGYWNHFRTVPDSAPLNQKHFVRLAFGLNSAVCSQLSR